MRTLKRITTRNLQSHKEVVIDLPKTGLVRFSGDNSNGKSVITKVTTNLIMGTIGNPKVRNTLISHKAMFGEILYEAWDDYKLLCHIQRDAAGTYLELTRPNGEVVRRYASEKSWSILTGEFGFIYNKDTGITLQVVDDDSPFLFLTTPPKTTYALINSAIADPVAELSLQNITEVYNEAQTRKLDYIRQKTVYSEAMMKFEVYDEEELEKTLAIVDKFLNAIKDIYIPELPKIPYMHKVHYYSVYRPNLPEVPYMRHVNFINLYKPHIKVPKYPKFYELYSPKIPNMLNVMNEVNQLRKGICPMCGRPMIEEDKHAC